MPAFGMSVIEVMIGTIMFSGLHERSGERRSAIVLAILRGVSIQIADMHGLEADQVVAIEREPRARAVIARLLQHRNRHH